MKIGGVDISNFPKIYKRELIKHPERVLENPEYYRVKNKAYQFTQDSCYVNIFMEGYFYIKEKEDYNFGKELVNEWHYKFHVEGNGYKRKQIDKFFSIGEYYALYGLDADHRHQTVYKTSTSYFPPNSYEYIGL